MRIFVSLREEIIVISEVATVVKDGLGKSGTVSVDFFQHCWVVVREMIGRYPDHRSVFLMCSLYHIGFAKFGRPNARP